jgi:adenine phosphoribosyltransferase
MEQYTRNLLKAVPNFPKPGIVFRDITPFLGDVKARNWAVAVLVQHYLTTPIDVVLGIESRGFLLGTLIADRLNLPFVMGRKPSKLPGEVEKIAYELEYGSACLEVQKNAIKANQKVLIVDDILATGGTLLAAAALVHQIGAQVSGLCCLAEISGLGGKEKIQSKTNLDCYTLLSYDSTLDSETKQNEKNEVIIAPPPTPVYKNQPFVLLYHISMFELANKLEAFHPHLFYMDHISWGHFPDGFPNIKFPDNLANKRVVFLASMFDKNTYLEQLSVMMVLPRQGIKSLDIILPYYAPGTMERIENPGILATADTFAQISSCCFPSTKEGPPVFSVFDLHNSTTRFSFSNNVQFWPVSAVPEVIKEMEQMCGVGNFAVAFPDEGSYKRFRGLMPKNQTIIVCGKMREGDVRKVRIMDVIPHQPLENFKHILIVDDLVQSGGTLHECYLALKTAGAKKVSAYVTHAVFPNRAYLHFFKGGKWEGLEHFWITDSIPKNAKLLEKCYPFKILSLSRPIVQDLVERYNLSDSLPLLNVAVASTNPDKIFAVQNAFESCFPGANLKILRSECKSNVPSQPIGLKETELGASNRLSELRNQFKNETVQFFVSIENGMDPNTHSDFGVVNMYYIHGNGILSKCTEEVKVDGDVWEMYRKMSVDNPNLTVGEVYKDQKKSLSSSNWHLGVCGKNRSYLLKNSIVKLLNQFLL